MVKQITLACCFTSASIVTPAIYADAFSMPGGLQSIQFVTVGNAGNTADTRYNPSGYGAVNYSFGMSKFEITAGQYTVFLNAVAKTDTYKLYNTNMWDYNADPSNGPFVAKIQRNGTSGNYSYSVASDWADRPVNWVSWADTARFSNWLTNGQPTGGQNASTTEDGAYRINGIDQANNSAIMQISRIAESSRVLGKSYFFIPTQDEWYKAAYHKNDGITGNYWYYPTGTDVAPGNSTEAPDSGNNANLKATPFAQPDGYAVGSPYYRSVVGVFQYSESPYGTYDQAGNVVEWTETSTDGTTRIFRGGSFIDIASEAGAAAYQSRQPYIEDSGIGFRIIVVPEPSTVSLLTIGCTLLLLRRKRKL
jgi:sulfatase modifying factor 1